MWLAIAIFALLTSCSASSAHAPELATQQKSLPAIRREALAENQALKLTEGAVLIQLTEVAVWIKTTQGIRNDSSRAIFAFVLTSNAAVGRVDLGPATNLEQLVTEWRAAMGAPIISGLPAVVSPKREPELGAKLRAALIDPCLAILEEKPTRIHVILDGFLHAVPVDALPCGAGDELTNSGLTLRLGDVTPVHIERSRQRSSVDELEFDVSDQGSFLAIGDASFGANPDITRPFKPLPGTRREVTRLSELYTRTGRGEALVLTEERATKHKFIEAAPKVRFLHIATHGWSLSDTPLSQGINSRPFFVKRFTPMNTVIAFEPLDLCGLAFAGANAGRDSLGRVPGILTGAELATLDLSHCELAVLSASKSAVGLRRPGQGMESLQYALHEAGVRTSLTSLWMIDDTVTRDLMQNFYEGIWEKGLGKAQALWRAKLALREQGREVRHWAAWVLSGDPN